MQVWSTPIELRHEVELTLEKVAQKDASDFPSFESHRDDLHDPKDDPLNKGFSSARPQYHALARD